MLSFGLSSTPYELVQSPVWYLPKGPKWQRGWKHCVLREMCWYLQLGRGDVVTRDRASRVIDTRQKDRKGVTHLVPIPNPVALLTLAWETARRARWVPRAPPGAAPRRMRNGLLDHEVISTLCSSHSSQLPITSQDHKQACLLAGLTSKVGVRE